MKIRLGVDAARSRLGRLEILDGTHRFGPFDACATADADAARAAGNAALDPLRPGGHAPFGTYVMKEIVAVDDARRPDLGDTAVMFEPRSGDARRAESLGRLVLALHGGALGADGRMRPTSAGVRLSADVLARVVAAARSHAGLELEIVEVPLSFWDWLFFWRRRPSRGFDTTRSATSTRDDDDDWRSSSGSGSGSGTSSRGDAFGGGGGSFGGAGASGSWGGTSAGTVAAAGVAIGVAGAAAAAASEPGSSGGGDAWSANDDASSGSDGGNSDGGSDADGGTGY